MVYKKGGCPDFTFYSFFLSEHPVRTPLKNMAPLSFLPDFAFSSYLSLLPPSVFRQVIAAISFARFHLLSIDFNTSAWTLVAAFASP